MSAASDEGSSSVGETILVYPGAGTDISPVALGSNHATIHKRFTQLCDRDIMAASANDTCTILEAVDRFVLFDIAPYRQCMNDEMVLDSRLYPTLDHFMHFMEVYLRCVIAEWGRVTHNKDEAYFECQVRGYGAGGKPQWLEWHYGKNFYAIDPKSRLHDLMQKANIVYLQGWSTCDDDDGDDDDASGDERDRPTIFNSFPNANVMIVQLGIEDKTSHREFERKFEANSNHERVNVGLHPNFTWCVHDWT